LTFLLEQLTVLLENQTSIAVCTDTNAQSICYKLNVLQHSPKFVTITETWCDKSVMDIGASLLLITINCFEMTDNLDMAVL